MSLLALIVILVLVAFAPIDSRVKTFLEVVLGIAIVFYLLQLSGLTRSNPFGVG